MIAKKKKEEERPVKPERMDYIEKGAKIGKSREGKKTEDKTKKS
jgi:hypothetical protein